MSFITMFDTAFNNQFPGGGEAYAGYVDGGVGDQPNYQWIVSTFPQAYHLSISIFGNDADCLDIEPGAASPSIAVTWYEAQKARGLARPCFYASASTMAADILPVITASGFPRSEIRLWSAHYGAGEHICGPGSCGLVPVDMDGTQWTSSSMGRTLDQSLLHGDFFGSAPLPPGYTFVEFNMTQMPVLQSGAVDVSGGGFWYVHRLQALVKETGILVGVPSAAGIVIDGAYGPLTVQAVKDVQGHYGISKDGITGLHTWNVLLTGSA